MSSLFQYVPITIRGTLQPLLQNEGWQFDPTAGYRHYAEFKGASRDKMDALMNSYARNGIACDLRYNQGGTATLYIDDCTQQYSIDTWQVVPNNLDWDILMHPSIDYMIGDAQTLTVDGVDIGSAKLAVMSAMRTNMQQAVRQDVAFKDDPVLKAYAAISPVNIAKLKEFYSLYQRGTTAYQGSLLTMRHTTNVASRGDFNVSDEGVDYIFTQAAFMSEVTDQSLWAYPMPPRLQTKLALRTSRIMSKYPQRTGYQYGWLKGESSESTSAHFRIDIATDYVFAMWSTALYTIY